MKKEMEWEHIKEICSKHKIDYENLRKEIFWVDYEDLYNTKNIIYTYNFHSINYIL